MRRLPGEELVKLADPTFVLLDNEAVIIRFQTNKRIVGFNVDTSVRDDINKLTTLTSAENKEEVFKTLVELFDELMDLATAVANSDAN